MSSKTQSNVSPTSSTIAKVQVAEIVPHKPITEIEELTAAWRSLEGQANLVSPVASFSSIPELHGVSLRAVIIDPATNKYGQGPEVYRDARFCEDDEVALGGVGLQKISAAAGVQFLSQRRLDDRSDPYYCEVEVTLGVRDFDGMWRQVIKTRAVDLRDGAPETLKPEKLEKPGGRWEKTGKMVSIDPSALADRRRHIQSLAETKAFHRALRTILTLKQKYTKAELAKPFVVPKLVAALDSSDPEQKRALIDMALGREAALYGPGYGGNEPTRILKDVTPAPTHRRDVASSAASPDPQQINVEKVDVDNGASDFELVDLPEPGPVALCDCPCGDQAEIAEEVARLTTERCGAPRCRECFPGKGFSLERHRNLRDLRLPKHPGLTAEQIVTAVQKGLRR